ncbi:MULTISPECIES: DUF2184 domain-containing protein [unclassified Rhizobium]|uniref:DUF2184 domain-containing protein n=1 Tax=unclassified Rhizobium TaxID=2613769 RepID=UPI0037F9343C
MTKQLLLVGSAALMTPHIIRARTRDALATFDQQTIDAAGAFLVGELERMDQTINEPLVNVTWSRDIDLREDVSIADEVASFTNSSFAAAGGTNPNGKAWIGKDANAIASMSLDIGKTPQPLNLWGMELSWTLPELASAQQIGRPIDTQKYDGMVLKHNMDVDEQVYIGDALLPNCYGLLNLAAVTPSNVPNGAGGSPLFINKTPDEILKDVNTLTSNAWTASGWAQAPTDLRLPPPQFSYLTSTKVSSAGNMSILQFIRENSLSNEINGRPINIQPLKWLVGRGAGGADRMMVYTKNPKYVRFPLVPLQRTPVEYRSLYQITTYYGRLGQVEARYPETIAYADGI